jgi:hypothetical protein
MADHRHTPTPDSVISIYQYCECGAVRRRLPDGTFEPWHVCDLCRVWLAGEED